MRRQGLGGRGALVRRQQQREKRGEQGAQLTAETAREMRGQLESFKRKLEQFALHHKKEIQGDPAFRARFHGMCAAIGVDPLTSRKGVWAELLGVGDYYYELAVRVVDVCVATRALNGGLLDVREVVAALRSRRLTFRDNVSADDVERAVERLAVLEGGFKVERVGERRLVRSVPLELTRDHTDALAVCPESGVLSLSLLRHRLGWSEHKANATLLFLLNNEFAWLDLQGPEPGYWVLGMVAGAAAAA